MTERVSAAEFGRRIGVSRAAVGKAIERGRLVKSVTSLDNGRYEIDPVVGAAEWVENNGRPDLPGADHKATSVPFAKRKQVDNENRSPIGAALSALAAADRSAMRPQPHGGALKTGSDPAGEDVDPDDFDGLRDNEGNPILIAIKSRRILEHYKALQQRLDYEKEIGSVVPVDEVAKTVGREYANVRAALLSIPSRIAADLLGFEDVGAVRNILEAAITDALSELTADKLPEQHERAA